MSIFLASFFLHFPGPVGKAGPGNFMQFTSFYNGKELNKEHYYSFSVTGFNGCFDRDRSSSAGPNILSVNFTYQAAA